MENILKVGIDGSGALVGAKTTAEAIALIKKRSKETDRSLKGMAARGAKAIFSLKGVIVTAGIAKLLKETSDAARGFETSVSELSAITGAVGDDLKFLADQSKEFGRTTTLSASQAAEAFKLVASAKPELLESKEALAAVTKEAITLAEAAGISLPDAAKTLGNSLNQFDAQADESTRFINVLAAGSKFGASSIEEISQAMINAGGAASTVGLSFEQTNAALQTLAASGIKGSEAGTGLKSVLLSLEKQNNAQFKPSVVGVTAAFENMNKANLDINQQMDIFGKLMFNQGSTLVKNAGLLGSLEQKLTGTNTAYEQAATRVDNFDGSLKQLKSALEGIFIEIGEKLNPALRAMADLTTELLNSFSEDEKAMKLFAQQIEPNTALIESFGISVKGIDSENLHDVNRVITAMRLNGIDLVKEAPFTKLHNSLGPLTARSEDLRNKIDALTKLGIKGADDAIVNLNKELKNNEAEIVAVTDQMFALRESQIEVKKGAEELAETDPIQKPDISALAEYESFIMSFRTPIQVMNDEIAATNALWLGNVITTEEYAHAIEQATTNIRTQKEVQASGDVAGAQSRLDRIIEEQTSERDLLAFHLEEKEFVIEEAFQLGLVNEVRRKELLENAETAHQKKLLDIELRGKTAAQKFAISFQRMELANTLKHGAQMTAGLANSSRAMFNVNKSFALASAAVSLPNAVLESFENGGGYPWGLIPAGLMLAQGLTQINAIRSANFGGGISTPTVSGGAGVAPSQIGSPGTPVTEAGNLSPELLQQGGISDNPAGSGVVYNINVNGSILTDDLDEIIADANRSGADRGLINWTVNGVPAEVRTVRS